jgi:hypothetical protein
MGFTVTQQGSEKNLVITNSVMTISSGSTRNSYNLSSATELTVKENSLDPFVYALPIVGTLTSGFGYVYFQSGILSPRLLGSFFLILGLGMIFLALLSYINRTEGDSIEITFDNGNSVQFVLTDGNTEAIISAFRDAAEQSSSEEQPEVQNEKN